VAIARPVDWRKPDYGDVYRERRDRLRRYRSDGKAGWDYAIGFYADGHAIEWIEDWLDTYDPRNLNEKRPAYVPFILFPRQQQLVAWMQDRYERREHGLIEKSRDCGLSWVSLAVALYLWSFTPGIKISFGSRKEALVDTLGNPDSLLEKIRLMLRSLPPELRPLGHSEREHARYMKIMNPENGAVITGEAGENIGRGGRSSIYFLDEAAFIEKPDAVEAALSQNTDVRFDISTPNGTGNPFYRKRMGGIVPVFTYHWRDDPRKDDAWYTKQKRELEPEVLAQEVDLDYEASAGDVVVSAKWVQASQALRRHLAENHSLPPRYDGVAGLDVGAGTAKSVFCPRWGVLVGHTTSWTDADTTNTAARARILATEAPVPLVKFDAIGVGRGVSAALKRMTGVEAHGINVGNPPTQRIWPDGKRSKDKFVNLRAELWWLVRERLRKTFEHWLYMNGQGGQPYELADLLLLPDDSALCGQLSLPSYSVTESGKIAIERKSQLEARGIASPDFADALCLSFAPAPARARQGRTIGHF
jgi:hypothetical protein